MHRETYDAARPTRHPLSVRATSDITTLPDIGTAALSAHSDYTAPLKSAPDQLITATLPSIPTIELPLIGDCVKRPTRASCYDFTVNNSSQSPHLDRGKGQELSTGVYHAGEGSAWSSLHENGRGAAAPATCDRQVWIQKDATFNHGDRSWLETATPSPPTRGQYVHLPPLQTPLCISEHARESSWPSARKRKEIDAAPDHVEPSRNSPRTRTANRDDIGNGNSCADRSELCVHPVRTSSVWDLDVGEDDSTSGRLVDHRDGCSRETRRERLGSLKSCPLVDRNSGQIERGTPDVHNEGAPHPEAAGESEKTSQAANEGLAIESSTATETPRDVEARRLMPPPPPDLTRAKIKRRRSRICLMHSPRYQRLCALVARHAQRDDLLYALVDACRLPWKLRVVAPARATAIHLRAFHDHEYVEALRNPSGDVKTLDKYGLLDDCEVFEELFDHCCAVAGASLHAADLLARGQADVAMNWGGGRHHAAKSQAAGFCYINDCVLAVLHLSKRFRRVLTLDIDVHHGDGLQEAFYTTDKVMTVSMHHLGKGFFPGGGHCAEIGAGRGRGFNVNVPLKSGCGDPTFIRVFTQTLEAVIDGFSPEAIVLICGADTLAADPLGPFNLTVSGIRACLEQVVGLELPLLILGGGGYCPTDTARLWTTLTAAAIGPEALTALPLSVPDHAYFPLYGPDFRIATRPKTVKDKNDEAFLTRLSSHVSHSGLMVRSLRENERATGDQIDSCSYNNGRHVNW